MTFRTALASLLALTTLISGCKAPVDTSKDRVPAWAVGGTLHNATLNRWVEGTEAEKFATIGTLLYESFWKGHLVSESDQKRFRDNAEQLVGGLGVVAGNQQALAKSDKFIYSRTITQFVALFAHENPEKFGPVRETQAIR